MQAALEAGKDVRVPMQSVTPHVERGLELATRGGQRSKVLHDMNKVVKNASDGNLSTREAQDFVSNASRMSANEFNKLSGPIQRQVAEVSKALRQALTESLDEVGKGEQYAKGVREYARGAKVEKYGKRAVQASGALYIGDHILRRITGAIESSAMPQGQER
jgi:methyl-accepting chemotaxis protein